jgi:hypothetical protein
MTILICDDCSGDRSDNQSRVLRDQLLKYKTKSGDNCATVLFDGTVGGRLIVGVPKFTEVVVGLIHTHKPDSIVMDLKWKDADGVAKDPDSDFGLRVLEALLNSQGSDINSIITEHTMIFLWSRYAREDKAGKQKRILDMRARVKTFHVVDRLSYGHTKLAEQLGLVGPARF